MFHGGWVLRAFGGWALALLATVLVTAGLASPASAQPILFTNFGAASVPLGGTTALTFNLSSSPPLFGALTGVGFTDTLPPGLVVATPNGLSFGGTCGPGSVVTATPGSGSISLAGGSSAAGIAGICSFSVNVTGVTAGTKTNSVTVTSNEFPGNTNSSTVTVNQGSSATTVASSANPSLLGQAITLTATVAGAGVTPTGTVTFKDGATTLGTGTLTAGGTATFPTSTLTVGSHSITAVYGGDGNCTASTSSVLTQNVQPGTQSQITIVVAAVGRDGSFAFSSTVPNASSFTLTTSGGSASRPFQNLGAGTYTVSQAAPPVGWKLTSVQCDGVPQSPPTATVTLTGLDSVTCTFTDTFDAQGIQTATQAAIRNFMQHRANAITSSEPDGTRGTGRLTGWLFGSRAGDGDARSGSPSNLAGRSGVGMVDRAPPVNNPFRVSGTAEDGAGALLFATSLSQIRQAAAASEAAKAQGSEPLMGLGGPTPRAASVSRPPAYDIWLEARTTFFDDTRGGAKQSGHTNLLYVGADYRVHPAILVGMLAQLDWASESSSGLGTGANGEGWMVGPYVAMRLTKNVTFDARTAWGQSSDRVNPFGLFEDSFSTNRSLVSGRLTGNWYHGPVRFTPSASLIYFRETQHDYFDQLNVFIPKQTVALGRLTFGPEVGYRFKMRDGATFEPFVGLKGVWDFDRDASTTIGGFVVGNDAWHGEVETGAVLRAPSGLSVRATAAYDGIGEKNFNAYEGRLLVAVPLN